MCEFRDTDGLVIVSAKIRDQRIRDEFWDHMEELPGERVNRTTYELNVGDWDDGLWDEEVEWLNDLLDGSGESVVIWKFYEGQYCRIQLGTH